MRRQLCTVAHCIQEAATQFARSNVPEPLLSAQHLMTAASGLRTRSQLRPEHTPEPSIRDRFNHMCRRRLKREPVQYIVGEWDFHDITLNVKPPVLIPRPETEHLVELVMASCSPNKDYRFLDVGSGSGAIGLALLHQLGSDSRCAAIDSLEQAVALSKENAALLRMADRYTCLHAGVGDTAVDQLGGDFDFIVSNPPYIPEAQVSALEPEVRDFESHAALAGGSDGMSVVRQLIQQAPSLLRQGAGTLWLEVDSSHPPILASEAANGGYHFVRSVEDFNGLPRFCELRFGMVERN